MGRIRSNRARRRAERSHAFGELRMARVHDGADGRHLDGDDGTRREHPRWSVDFSRDLDADERGGLPGVQLSEPGGNNRDPR